MKNRIFKVLCLFLTSVFFFQTVHAAGDPNIDGGGSMGQGSNNNGWAVNARNGGLIYDAEGLRYI